MVTNGLIFSRLSSAGLLDECIIHVCSAISAKATIIELEYVCSTMFAIVRYLLSGANSYHSVSSNEITGLGARTLAQLLSEENCAITKLK